MEAAVEFLKSSDVVPQLKSLHDLVVYRFDQTQRPTMLTAMSKPKDSTVDSPTQTKLNELWATLRLSFGLERLVPGFH